MRMHWIIIGLLLSWSLSAQNYYVISVEGTIYADETPLAPKSRLTPNTQLRFTSEDAEAKVMAPGKGYYLLSAEAGSTRRGSEFFAAVKDALIPPSQYTAASTRSGWEPGQAFVLDEFDLEAFFRNQVLLFDTLKLQLNPEVFPSDEAYHFGLQAQSGSDTTLHTLYPQDGYLYIYAEKDGWQLEEGVIYRFSYTPFPGEELEVLSEFQFVRAKEAVIINELNTLKELSEAGSELEFFVGHALPYIHSHYGSVDPARLYEWWEEQ